MEAAPKPHLRAVDEHTGELHLLDTCPRCQGLEDQLAGANTDVATWRSRFAMLKRDKERDAHKDPLWPQAVRLFGLWQEITGHKRSVFNYERFEMVEPLLKQKPPKGGIELCVRAIVGQDYDPFVTTRKNGTKKRHDGWHLCFGTRDKFEEACNKAPKDWRERAEAAGWDFADLEKQSASAGNRGALNGSTGTTTTKGSSIAK